MSLEKLIERREVWKKKRILRKIFADWSALILENIKGAGKTVELGSGSGFFKEFMADVVSTDMVRAPWLDLACDATRLPFRDGSLGNIVMTDVLHHMADPVGFFSEAERVLAKGGRVVVLEPYGSPLSLAVYRRFHEEPFIFEKNYFSEVESEAKDPWEANQAIYQILFFKEPARFEERFRGRFKVVLRRRLSFILYPLSGGFGNRSLVPSFLAAPLSILESLLDPLAPLFAFRSFVVIEKI